MELPCPVCGAPALQDRTNPSRPFCSARCKLVDLDRWLSGDYRIPGPEVARDPSGHSGTGAEERGEIPDERDA